MGEKENKPFQLTFNGFLKVDFQGSRVTSDGGLILVRELDERLGLGQLIDEHLSDSRQGLNKKFALADLLRQSVYSRLAGYEDLNDAVRVSADPTFRLIGSKRNWDRGAALTSTLHGFETEMLASEENLLGLMAAEPRAGRASGSVPTTFRAGRSGPGLHRESGPWPTGRQCLQRTLRVGLLPPTVAFVQPVMVIASAAKLRPGNVHSAEDWDELLVAGDRAPTGCGQAGRRSGAMRPLRSRRVYEAIGGTRSGQYAIRIPANKSLELEIEDILFRPPGRPSAQALGALQEFSLSGRELVAGEARSSLRSSITRANYSRASDLS